MFERDVVGALATFVVAVLALRAGMAARVRACVYVVSIDACRSCAVATAVVFVASPSESVGIDAMGRWSRVRVLKTTRLDETE